MPWGERVEHAGRRAADTIQREAELSLIDSGFDLFRYIGRIDYDDISADRLELGHKLGPPDDVYGLQAARFRKRDNPTPDPGIGRVLHHPLTRLQVDVLAEQQRCGRRSATLTRFWFLNRDGRFSRQARALCSASHG